MSEKNTKRAEKERKDDGTDKLSILPYENLEDIFSIYTKKNVLLVLDPRSENHSYFLSLFDRLQDRFLDFEKIVLDYESIGFEKAYGNLKEIVEKERFSFYVGDGIGATYLRVLKAGKTMALNPYVDKEHLDALADRLGMAKEDHPFLEGYFEEIRIAYAGFAANPRFNYPYVYFDNTLYDDAFLKSHVSFSYVFKNVHLGRSKAYQKEFIEELIHCIRDEAFSMEETRESRKTIGIDVVRNENWKKDWLPFILYDQHYEPQFFYRLILHKLGLMRELFSDRRLGPRNPYTFSRVKSELETAYLLFEPTIYAYDCIENVDALENGFASGIVVYYENGSPVFYWERKFDYTSLDDPGIKQPSEEKIRKTIKDRYKNRKDFTIKEYKENPDFKSLLSLTQKDVLEEDMIRIDRAKKIRMTAFEYIADHSDEWTIW